MKGIQFGNVHSYNDLHLILAEKQIGTPNVKKVLLDLPGGHGKIDQTEAFGEVKYDNRELSFDFSTIVPQEQFMDLFSQVQNALHGKKMRIILDDDPAWFYTGRVEVSEWKANKRVGKLTIDCDCDPFKQSLQTTTVSQRVTSNANIILPNDKMPVVPTITTTTAFLISFGGYNDEYPAGTFSIPELELHEGNNQVYVEGNGNITFTWQKGRL
jgi:phage-related protein